MTIILAKTKIYQVAIFVFILSITSNCLGQPSIDTVLSVTGFVRTENYNKLDSLDMSAIAQYFQKHFAIDFNNYFIFNGPLDKSNNLVSLRFMTLSSLYLFYNDKLSGVLRFGAYAGINGNGDIEVLYKLKRRKVKLAINY